MGDGNRDRIVKVCVTDAEAARLRARAAAAGRSVSSYMRARCLAGGEERVASALDTRELRPLYQELRRCGNNLNQIARALNSFGPGAVPESAVESALGSLCAATDAVAGALSRARR